MTLEGAINQALFTGNLEPKPREVLSWHCWSEVLDVYTEMKEDAGWSCTWADDFKDLVSEALDLYLLWSAAR